MIQHTTVGTVTQDSITDLQNIYVAPCLADRALRRGSHSFTCKLHHACLLFVSVHQMAPPLTEIVDIRLQLTTHLSTPKG